MRTQREKKKRVFCSSKKLTSKGMGADRCICIQPGSRGSGRAPGFPLLSTRGNPVKYPPNRRDWIWLATAACANLEPQETSGTELRCNKRPTWVGFQECTYILSGDLWYK